MTTTRHHQELYGLLVESLFDYAIFLLEPDGKVLTWAPGAESMAGYRKEEIVGKHFSAFYRQEDVDLGKPQKLLQEAAAKGRVEDEGFRVRKDGSTYWANVVITALRDHAGRLVGYGKIVRDATDGKQADETLRNLNAKLDRRVTDRTSEIADKSRELRASLGQLRALAARMQSVREDERTSIAREMHDELGQALTAMKMDLVWMMPKLRASPKSLHLKANSMLKLIDDTIRSVRRMAFELRPGMLDDLGLSAAVEWQAQEFQARTGIEFDLDLPDENIVLDNERSTAFFRIFQETLTNIARHAQATRVTVSLTHSDHELVLKVVDNGRGFENGVITEKKSLGLLGMKERALILGGAFELLSAPGQGTSLTIRVPLGPPQLEGV